MSDIESNIQAYRTMADVLISFRKIMLRGLYRLAGDNWHLDACPPGVYERLIERKESELAIQRFAPEEDDSTNDLMTFATFDDLAEILEYNEELARLLKNLSPSKEILCARFNELEALRKKLANGRVLGAEELAILSSYSTNLRRALDGARRRAKEGTKASPPAEPAPGEPELTGRVEPPAAPGPSVETEVEGLPAPADAQVVPEPVAEDTEAEPLDELVDVVTEVAELDTAVDIASADAMQDAEDLEESEAEEESTTPPDTSPVSDTEVGDADVEEPVLEAADGGPEEEAEESAAEEIDDEAIDSGLSAEMKRALAEGDDRAILRLLRHEIIAVAEAVHRVNEEIGTGAWRQVASNGWFDDRKADLGLEPLEEFHELVEEIRIGMAEGLDPDALKELLAERGFSKMLLTLREIFLRNEV